MGHDYFEFFGLERRLHLDTADLEKRFYRLSRELHPDRHVRSTPAERERALDLAAILNDAYRTLRDPVKRAEHLLKREEVPPPKQPPADLLSEVFELNMALDELRGGDNSVRPQLDAARTRFLAVRAEIDASLDQLFAAYDGSPAPETLAAVRATLDRRKYIDNLVRQVESVVSPDARVPAN